MRTILAAVLVAAVGCGGSDGGGSVDAGAVADAGPDARIASQEEVSALGECQWNAMTGYIETCEGACRFDDPREREAVQEKYCIGINARSGTFGVCDAGMVHAWGGRRGCCISDIGGLDGIWSWIECR